MTAPDVIGCPEAEAAVLGALMRLSALEASYLAEQLEPEDFADPRCRAVYVAALKLLNEDVNPDAVVVLGELRRSAAERSMTADKSGGVYLYDLLAAAPAVSSAGHYARIVREHSARRRVAEAACRLDQLAASASMDVLAEVAADELRAVLTALDRTGHASARPAGPRSVAA